MQSLINDDFEYSLSAPDTFAVILESLHGSTATPVNVLLSFSNGFSRP